MTSASSGSDRKIIYRAIGQFLKKILICNKQCTKNDHYFKSCHYLKTKKVLKSNFWPIKFFSKTLNYQLFFLTQMPLLLYIDFYAK